MKLTVPFITKLMQNPTENRQNQSSNEINEHDK